MMDPRAEMEEESDGRQYNTSEEVRSASSQC